MYTCSHVLGFPPHHEPRLLCLRGKKRHGPDSAAQAHRLLAQVSDVGFGHRAAGVALRAVVHGQNVGRQLHI